MEYGRTILLILLVVTATLAGATSAFNPTAERSLSHQPQKLAYSPDNSTQYPVQTKIKQINQSTFQVTFLIPNDTPEELTIALRSPRRITASPGFDVRSTDLFEEATLASGDASNASLTVQVNVAALAESSRCVCIVTTSMLLGPLPRGYISWQQNDSLHSYPLMDYYNRINVSETDSENNSYISPWVAYFGPATTEVRTANNQQISVVAPKAASPNVRPSKIADSIATTAQTLNIGSPYPDNIHVFVIPLLNESAKRTYTTTRMYGARTVGNGTILVDETAPLWTYTHEYAHARSGYGATPSTFPLTNSTMWLNEGFASYYGWLSAYHQGSLSWGQFRSYVTTNDTGTMGPLRDRSQWKSNRTPYIKGAALLGVLDAKIRNATDRATSLEEVFSLLIEVDDTPITMEIFKDAVATVVGDHRFDDFISAAVRTGKIPSTSSSNWQLVKTPESDKTLDVASLANQTPESTGNPVRSTKQSMTPVTPTASSSTEERSRNDVLNNLRNLAFSRTEQSHAALLITLLVAGFFIFFIRRV